MLTLMNKLKSVISAVSVRMLLAGKNRNLQRNGLYTGSTRQAMWQKPGGILCSASSQAGPLSSVIEDPLAAVALPVALHTDFWPQACFLIVSRCLPPLWASR